MAFITTGGDAWAFQKTVDVSVADKACDEVVFTTVRGASVARPKSGRASARILLAAGRNRVEAECRRDGLRDGRPAWQDWLVRLRDAPTARPRLQAGQAGIVLDASGSEEAPAHSERIVSYVWQARPGNPAPLAGMPAQGKRIVLGLPALDGLYFVKLRVVDASGAADNATTAFRVRAGHAEPVTADAAPDWIDDAVVYGVVPSFFGRRGFADVTARLDKLVALGVNALWLSPFTAAPPGNFGYAVTDYFNLRPDFGDADDLHTLIGAAHARGMHVIMDFVANHLSERHPYFVDVAAHARASPYYDFFVHTHTGDAAYYFNWRDLKNLNYDDPEVQRFIIEASAYWVREFDIDGFRVDAAWGPRERAPQFWPRWRAELKRIKPDLLLLAEASARDPYYFRNGFDAAYDWSDELGQWAWHDAFDVPALTASRLRAAIGASRSQDEVFRFLENNDTGSRFVIRHGLPRTRVAAAMLLTLPGLPGLFTGEEIGAAYDPYSPAHPIAWDDDPNGLRSWFAKCIALRHAYPALRSRALRFIEIPGAEQVLAYVRPGADPADSIVVILNYGSRAVDVALPADVLAGLGAPSGLSDVVEDPPLTFPAGAALPLPGFGVRILKVAR
ncbi:MAG TPA: alpha-amylase family glycosyl hydrolase [Xanthobacteraceae bacterium]|nr:alpha-amylase family glycosyl hydrolase [Xanthobacteraceae bacterium]